MTIIIVAAGIAVFIVVFRAVLARLQRTHRRRVQELRDHAEQRAAEADEYPAGSFMRLMTLDTANLDRAEANRLEDFWGLK